MLIEFQMKKLLFYVLIAFVVSSCSKWKDEKYIYYCEDYQEKDMNLLGINTSQIDAMWVEFSAVDKKEALENYTFIVKSNGVLYQESGTFQTDWVSNITFTPVGNTPYFATWTDGKEKFRLAYIIDERSNLLNFKFKEHKCKK